MNTFEYDIPQLLSIQWFDRAGQPTQPPPGVVPSWAASDEAVAKLTPSPDGQTCSLVGIKAGPETVTMTGGSIVAKADLTLTPGVAVSAQIVVTPK